MRDGIKVDLEYRKLFVAFVERLASGEADREQWQQLVVNHYLDETLERIRRDVGRLRMQNEAMRWSPGEAERIQAWLRDLRTPTDP